MAVVATSGSDRLSDILLGIEQGNVQSEVVLATNTPNHTICRF